MEKNATWFDVLTNKISVDRSSVGNALYLVLNLASNGGNATGKNYASIEEWAKSRPTQDSAINPALQYQQQHNPPQQKQSQGQPMMQQQSQMNQFETMYQMQLKAQEQIQQQMFQQVQMRQENNGLQQQPFMNHQHTMLPSQQMQGGNYPYQQQQMQVYCLF